MNMDAKEKRKLELEAKRAKVEAMRKKRVERDANTSTSAAPAEAAAKKDINGTIDDVTNLLEDMNVTPREPARADVPEPVKVVTAPPTEVTAAGAAPEKPLATLSTSSIGICSIAPKVPELYTKEVQTDDYEPQVEEGDEEGVSVAGDKPVPDEDVTPAPAEEADAPPPVRQISEAEAKEVMGSATFVDFISESSRVMERALGQADEYDIMVDYTQVHDQAKDTDGVSLHATFFDERWSVDRPVTDVTFHPTHPEALYAAYHTRADGAAHDPDGVVLMWSAALRQRPEYTFTCQSAVLAITATEFAPTVLIGATYSGQIVMWDARAKSTPVQRSALSSSAHTHPVYSVAVVGTQNAHNLITVSNNGRVCSWDMNKLVQPKETVELKSKGTSTAAREVEVAATCLATPEEEFNQFFVGSEDGVLCDCSRHGAKAGVQERFTGHFGPVTGIDLHPSKGAMNFSDLVLTSSMDWTIKLWSKKNAPHPIYTFEGGSDYIYDAKWSPVHPAMFASVDGTGSLDLWQLNEDSEMPRYKIQVSDRAMNRLQWSKDGRHIVTGNTQGHVYLYDVAQEVAVPGDGDWQRFDETLAVLRDSGERAAAAETVTGSASTKR